MNKFGEFIKTEISRNNISQNKFAEKLGVSSYYLGQLMKGEKRPPSRELQLRIVEILDLNTIKQIEFFDLIAKEKRDIPSDIYNDVINNEEKWNDVRKLLSKGEVKL